MNIKIQNCEKLHLKRNWCNKRKRGINWGCIFLETKPKYKHRTEKEKAELFSSVYSEAENKGITKCKFFNSLQIEETIDSISKDIKERE